MTDARALAFQSDRQNLSAWMTKQSIQESQSEMESAKNADRCSQAHSGPPSGWCRQGEHPYERKTRADCLDKKSCATRVWHQTRAGTIRILCARLLARSDSVAAACIDRLPSCLASPGDLQARPGNCEVSGRDSARGRKRRVPRCARSFVSNSRMAQTCGWQACRPPGRDCAQKP